MAVAFFANACVCNASECGSTESATIRLMHSASELQGAQAIACRNDICQTISLQPLADGLAGSAETPLEVAGPYPEEGVVLDAYAQPTADGFVLTLVWGFDNSNDLHVGDELSARVSDRNADELFAGAGKVAVLERDAPEDCGAGCFYVKVSLE
jgi:hypothetical protein